MKIKTVCKSCKGTGVYKGMAEIKNVGVVCSRCKGTGCDEIEYEPFTKKERKAGIKKIFEYNPGIGIDDTVRGGMSYNDWFDGKPFPPKSEIREFTCPAWWYHNIKLCPVTNQILPGTCFSDCPYFKNKEMCWEHHDKSQFSNES